MSKKIHNKRKRQMASDSKEADEDDDENGEHNLQKQKKIKSNVLNVQLDSHDENKDLQVITKYDEGENKNINHLSKELKNENINTNHDDESCEKLQNIYSELYDDHDLNKPFDLSIKSKCPNIESKISISISSHKNDKESSSSEDEAIMELPKSEFSNSLSNSNMSQELILAHLSKLQQHFVVNLLQYQASFIAHYQQFQQHMMAKGDISTDAEDEEKSSNTDDKFDGGESDKDETESSKASSPEFQLGDSLISSNILRNLVPFALYPRLLQILPGANASNPFSNITATDLSHVYSQESENEEENASEMPTLREHLIKQSNEAAQLSTYSSSDDTYSILGSLIGASKERNLTSNYNDNDLSEEIGTDISSNLQNKRKRIAFSAKQYELLQTTFEHNNFPEPADQQCIARQLKAPYRSIKMWFQNKRANARKKLLPGEKGSGRTPAGEKIPGDTDTRFYCDKCPSAFICQIFLNNHLHAHTLYTKSCHKCHVTFTHDCLLMTHTISKCGKKEDKKTDEFKENDDGVLDLKFLTKLKSTNVEGNLENYTHLNGKDYCSVIPSAILSQLKSSLPLLTLLQIQKKQEEQKREELIEQMETDSKEPNSNLLLREHNYSESSDEDKLEIDECDDSALSVKVEQKIIPKDLPPLIPSEFVTSEMGTSSKFAILRQLLTNNAYCKKNSENEVKVSSDNTKERTVTFNINEVDDTQNHNVPQNIPEHLYQLLDNHMDLSQPTKSNEYDQKVEEPEEYESMETNLDPSVINGGKIVVEKRKNEIDEDDTTLETKFIRGPKAKRLRRRTTVFTENQHRILYLHFTHCNFPDPAMFRILSKLTGLTPHVIKIWFQNERSRQRRQVSASEEVIKEKKPYKCRDCGVEFAMPAFLVKHCMRHIPTDNVTSQARKCPICMVEFETQKLHSHFMASHNLSVTMEDEGATEKNICHLCQDQFPDLSTLSLHKNEHLKDTHYGDPPQCYECKTTFVNVLCLEAHMATHDKFTWEHYCMKCKMKFYDKILLESHLMTHSINNNNNNSEDNSNEVSLNHSKYLVSLAQKITSDSKLKPILPKEELENSVNIQLKSRSKECGKSQCCDDSNKLIIDTKSPPHMSTSNVSFKLIPVKFIPVNTSQSSAVSNSSSVSNSQVTVVASPMLTIQNDENLNANEHIKQNGKYIIGNLSGNDVDIKCLSQKKEDISEKAGKGLKKVPNLIPISETFSFKPFEFINGTVVSPEKSEKDNEEAVESQEKKTGDSSASSVSSDHDEANDSSQVLLYTPYASEYRKRRRTPTHFNSSQRDILEAYYKYDNFPDPNEQLQLSEYLQVPYSVIKTWFQNTRKNHRKHLKVSTTSEVGGPFECSECRVCFVSKIYIDSHIKQHQDIQPYSCTICNLQFPHIAVQDIHIKMGCSKKIKKKHDHIRQFSSNTVINKVPQPEYNYEIKERSETCDKKINIPIKLTRSIFQASNKVDSNVKFVSLKYVELCKDSNILKSFDINEEINNQNLHLLSNVTAHHESLVKSSVPLCKENSSKIQLHECVQCSIKFSSLNLLTSHIKNVHKGVSETGNYVPQIVGYTCPQCNQTFQSFLEIAEHKENLMCLHPKHDSIMVQGRTAFKKVRLSYGELIDLYKVPCSKSLPLNISLESVVSLNNSKYSLIKDMNKKLKKLKSANLNFLKLHYNYNNFPSSKEISLMSKKLGIDRERVAFWFQKKRTRERKGNTIASTVLCQSCSSAFVHQDALKEHQQSVHNPSAICIQFICPVENCKMKYPNSTLLQTHQMSHEETMDAKKIDLKFHGGFLEAHYLENNFPTPMDVGFIARRLNVESLSIHWWFKERRAKHLMNLENKLKCKFSCLDNHLANWTKEKSTAVAKECEVCDSAFIDEVMLQKHISTHSTDLSLICFECGADFANPLVFETHMVHHGITSADDVFSLNKSLKIKSDMKFKYSFLQLQILWNHYKHNNFAKKDEVKLLSRRLKIPMKHVQTWYKNQKSLESARSNPGAKSSNGNSSVSSKQNGENFNLKCTACLTEFVSPQHMLCHTLIHKLGCSYSCDACSKTFCTEIIRDTHTLSHYSGLGLKAKVQLLDRELRTALKKLVNDCKDAALFSVANNGIVFDNEDSLSEVSDAYEENNQCNNDECSIEANSKRDNLNEPSDDFEHLNVAVSSPIKSSHYDEFNCMSSILQIDNIDEDVDVNTEDEDDELKLVIDE